MATPHNTANPGDIAETILLPGRPAPARSSLQKPIWKTWFSLIQYGICLDIPEHIKESVFLLWGRAWECLQWEYTVMS